MDKTRVAVISIIVEDDSSTAELNALLSDFADYVIGRMGVPYKERGVRLISVAVDAPQDSIAALSGKIGALSGVSVKTAYASI
jgi:putative iron-only hydrogenase system regulator